MSKKLLPILFIIVLLASFFPWPPLGGGVAALRPLDKLGDDHIGP